MFYYPTSIDRTERCYQFVITSLLSIKDSRDILISINYTINLYIFVTDLIDNHILFPYRIFIICPKADPFGEIRLHSRKHLKIFKLIINLFYRLHSIFLVVFGNVIPNILQIPPHDGQHPTIQLYTSLLPGRIRDFHPLERAHGAQTKSPVCTYLCKPGLYLTYLVTIKLYQFRNFISCFLHRFFKFSKADICLFGCYIYF